MKKLVSVIIALVLTVALAVPAFAVGYRDSVTASGTPTFLGGSTGGTGSTVGGGSTGSGSVTGGAVVGGIINQDGSKKEDIKEEQVVIKPVEGSNDQELKDAYEDLKKEQPTLSEDLGSQLGGSFTAKDVFKVEESEEGSLGEIAPGESVEFTFEVGVDVHTHMVAARFVDGEWVTVNETVNNGDGTITVAMEEIGTLCLFTVTPENEELVTIEKEPITEREIAGHLVNEKDEVLSITYQDCLIITPVEDVPDSFYITGEEKLVMKEFHDGIKSGEISFTQESPELEALVKEKLGADATADELSLLELLDVKVICHELTTYLPPEHTTVTLTFNIGVAADAEVFVVTYKNDKVVLAEDVVNNGDGTVTATFESFCPVAFLVNETEAVVAEGTCALCHGFFGAGASPIPALCLICFIIVIALILLCGWIMYKYLRKKAEKETK